MSIFKDKTLLITGGTGSFGNAVLRRFLNTDIREIRIFSRDEKKQDDMRHEYQVRFPEVAHKIKFFIGDVRSLESCRSAMPGVDYIFHAAALKQVPSCEFFPMEAVKTNVIGTDNVLTAAIEAGVEAVICLSTDKAAYPINAMGITKAIEEKVAVAKSRFSGKTKICCTRYGNVMCSRGSVIPLWIEQMRAGNPITITEPSMTRFIMSLDEAVDLVIFAFENGCNGDILVQKAPACTIATQAEAVCELFGGRKEDYQGYRNTARREDVRDSAYQRGMRQGRGPGQLLPCACRQPRTQLRQVLQGGRRDTQHAVGVQLQQHPPARRGGDKGQDCLARIHPERAERKRQLRPITGLLSLCPFV